jgi:Fe-S cluster assembly protein SufD
MFSFTDEEIWQDASSVFQINTLTLDGSLVRNDLHIQVQGEHAETHLNGMYMLNGQQHVANYSTVDHQVANCESHELYKGIMDDKSVAVFNGKVFVRKDAQKTNAYQSNANVLISDDASVNSKPELEIYADDVKCSHGSTTGQLDDDAIFYLRARGLSEKSAKQLMLTAFMSDVLDKITIPEVKAKVFKTINKRFNWELEL